MPKLMTQNDTDVIKIAGPGTFQFSAMRIEDLGATEYTLFTIVCDISGSVSGYSKQLMNCIKEIIKACQKSPRAENLLLRVLLFNNSVQEVHGFVNLVDIDITKYDDLVPDGMTALFDATYDAVAATVEYSKRLVDQDFECNGFVCIITDGMDNRSSMTPKSIKEINERAIVAEQIESNMTILIALNDPKYPMVHEVKQSLEIFYNEAGLTQFVDVGDATDKHLAKVLNFVSQSVSSQSQALGSGVMSQSLQF
jgi:uncharacterized protein YegL